jgi:prephenate dehydrogenase
MAVRKNRLADTVIGIGPREDELKQAVALGAIDDYATDDRKIKGTVEKADLVVLAAPVGRLETAARDLASSISKSAVVTDVGSVKGPLVRRLEALFSPDPSSRSRFVGGHPIAGRETSGVKAASANLFSDALCILTPTDRTDPKALETIQQFWEAIGSRTVSMEPEAHDRILSVVSHLPHLVAYALVNTVLELESKNGDLLS